MSLAQVINVQIARNTTAVSIAGFGIPIFFTDGGDAANPVIPIAERVRKITDAAGAAALFGADSAADLAAQAYFTQNPNIPEMFLAEILNTGVGAESISESIDAAVDKNSEWYVATYSSRVVDDQIAFGQKIAGLSASKISFLASHHAENYNSVYDPQSPPSSGDDLSGRAAGLNSDRIITMYSQAADFIGWTSGDANPFPECAFAGHNLPFEAGAATWAYLQLQGVPVATVEDGSVGLSATEFDNIYARNANLVENIAGVNVTREGKVSSGEWIDIIRGVDNMDEDITKALFSLLVNQQGGKVPFTNAGMNQIRNVIEGQLQVYVNRGFIVGNFVVSVPDANNAIHDKPNRQVNGVKFIAQLQGAVHSINVSGVVTYDVPVAA